MALIEVKNAIKTYQMGDEVFHALNDVSFSITEGEFGAIMGTSGSGKSTCMNMLGTLDKPSSGEYYLDGVNVFSLSADELSDIRNNKIGFVFQGFNRRAWNNPSWILAWMYSMNSFFSSSVFTLTVNICCPIAPDRISGIRSHITRTSPYRSRTSSTECS